VIHLSRKSTNLINITDYYSDSINILPLQIVGICFQTLRTTLLISIVPMQTIGIGFGIFIIA